MQRPSHIRELLPSRKVARRTSGPTSSDSTRSRWSTSAAGRCADALVGTIAPCATTLETLMGPTGDAGCLVASHATAVAPAVVSDSPTSTRRSCSSAAALAAIGSARERCSTCAGAVRGRRHVGMALPRGAVRDDTGGALVTAETVTRAIVPDLIGCIALAATRDASRGRAAGAVLRTTPLALPRSL